MKTMLLAASVALAVTPPAFAQAFMGYPCTVDCSGHEAGYEWAERNGINNESDCGGNSNSFVEGCQAYVEENADTSDNDSYTTYDDDEDSEDGNYGDEEE